MCEQAENLSRAYADYLVVDVKNDVKSVEDAIDDTLTRLDEFSGLIDVIGSQMNPQICINILSRKAELFELFQRVRKLEFAVSQVRQTVDTMDHLVSTAETELGLTTEGKIITFLKPLFKKKSAPIAPVETTDPVFVNPPVFSTKEIFSKSDSPGT